MGLRGMIPYPNGMSGKNILVVLATTTFKGLAKKKSQPGYLN